MAESDQSKSWKMIRDITDSLGGIPDNYFCIDTETTGFAKADDLIVSFGFCDVNGQQAEDYSFSVFNWLDHPLIDRGWLEHKLNNCRYHMEKAGRSFHGVTIDMMRESGSKPEEVFEEFLELLLKAHEEGKTFVGHNFASFDIPRIEFALNEWLGVEFKFDPEKVFDTAAIEKGSICGMMPYPDETKLKYFRRVLAAPRGGVQYKLDINCVPKYELAEKYGLDMSEAHKNPGFDAMLCHLLTEEFREIAMKGG